MAALPLDDSEGTQQFYGRLGGFLSGHLGQNQYIVKELCPLVLFSNVQTVGTRDDMNGHAQIIAGEVRQVRAEQVPEQKVPADALPERGRRRTEAAECQASSRADLEFRVGVLI